MTQTEIAVPPGPQWPELPPPPAYWPSTVSRYARHKVRARDHCHVDVRLIHDGTTKLPPRPAEWRRRGLPTDKDALLLCGQHAREYRSRDNVARMKAGIVPLGKGRWEIWP